MIVLTGGPGAGKTSLLESLQASNFNIVKESGRSVLQSEGGISLRQNSPDAYAIAMFEIDKSNFQTAKALSSITIFDRGLPDIVGYLNLMKLDIPKSIEDACHELRYSGPIFTAPPWFEIYEQDAERNQDFDAACRTFDAVCLAWRKYGYELTELPKLSILKRKQFVLDKIT